MTFGTGRHDLWLPLQKSICSFNKWTRCPIVKLKWSHGQLLQHHSVKMKAVEVKLHHSWPPNQIEGFNTGKTASSTHRLWGVIRPRAGLSVTETLNLIFGLRQNSNSESWVLRAVAELLHRLSYPRNTIIRYTKQQRKCVISYHSFINSMCCDLIPYIIGPIS
jgi:hypothetical protein